MTTAIGEDLARDRKAGLVTGVPIKIDARYADVVTAVSASGVIFQVGADGTVKVPVRKGSSALVMAEDKNHNPVAAAIAIADEDLDATQITLGDESTAFTRIVTSPPLLTSDPGTLWAIRIAASESPGFADLVDAIAAQAPTTTSFAVPSPC